MFTRLVPSSNQAAHQTLGLFPPSSLCQVPRCQLHRLHPRLLPLPLSPLLPQSLRSPPQLRNQICLRAGKQFTTRHTSRTTTGTNPPMKPRGPNPLHPPPQLLPHQRRYLPPLSQVDTPRQRPINLNPNQPSINHTRALILPHTPKPSLTCSLQLGAMAHRHTATHLQGLVVEVEALVQTAMPTVKDCDALQDEGMMSWTRWTRRRTQMRRGEDGQQAWEWEVQRQEWTRQPRVLCSSRDPCPPQGQCLDSNRPGADASLLHRPFSLMCIPMFVCSGGHFAVGALSCSMLLDSALVGLFC